MSSLRQSHDIDLESAANSDHDIAVTDGGGGDRLVTAVADGGGPHRFEGIEIVRNENKKGQHERRESNASDCSVEIVDLEAGVSETKFRLAKTERECRICHLSLDAVHQDSGVPIELGCSCKDDLAAAHKHCAEAWFKIRGNKTCEICGSIARNVINVNEVGSAEPCNDGTEVAPPLPAAAPAPSSQVRNLWQGHRFLNFLLACMVFAFVVSWLFHFNVRS
ncbi:hypothetical protein F511_29523 [Dorcoceras hygrometricum]|uniref:RING-CH-type domain-containing protein n=1 Tax=Dorcoceras hygrometricum TaxID=472368 RepID=A0A2Z7D0A2_9LAMI|nr:hypothetical protein F511_29523 [Dorcoceras hygrometricum]